MTSEPNSVRNVRCAIYTRCATGGAISTEEQKQQCKEFVRKNGWIVDATYSDVQRPGTALQSLIADAVKTPHQFDLVLVADTSRLSRSLDNILTISRMLSSHGITIHFVNEGLNSSEPLFRRIESLHGTMDEAYLAALAERVREGTRTSNKK